MLNSKFSPHCVTSQKSEDLPFLLLRKPPIRHSLVHLFLWNEYDQQMVHRTKTRKLGDAPSMRSNWMSWSGQYYASYSAGPVSYLDTYTSYPNWLVKTRTGFISLIKRIYWKTTSEPTVHVTEPTDQQFGTQFITTFLHLLTALR